MSKTSRDLAWLDSTYDTGSDGIQEYFAVVGYDSDHH